MHFILGAGTSAVALALRLCESNQSVTIIEAGNERDVELYMNIIAKDWYAAGKLQSENLENLVSSPVDSLSGRIIEYPRGHGLGGTSNINAMIWTLGSHAVYNTLWPKSWNFESIEEYQSLLLNLLPLQRTSREYDVYSLVDSLGSNRFMIGNLLKNYVEKGQIIMRYNQRVLKLLTTSDRVTGIQVVNADSSIESISIDSSDDVILSCGAFETPQILHRSFLEDTAVVCPLQDHVIVPVINFSWKRDLEAVKTSFDCDNVSATEAASGILGCLYLDDTGCKVERSTFHSEICPIQLLLVDGSISVSMLPDLALPCLPRYWIYNNLLRPLLRFILIFLSRLWLFRYLLGHSYGILVCLVNPKSTGHIKYPKNGGIEICPGLLSSEVDQRHFNIGIRKAQSYLSSSRASSSSIEVLPGIFSLSNRLLNIFCSLFSSTYFHACGTVPMLTSLDQKRSFCFWVDEHGKFLSGKYVNLRICDASVIPSIPSSSIQAMCMIIGLKIADDMMKTSSIQGY